MGVVVVLVVPLVAHVDSPSHEVVVVRHNPHVAVDIPNCQVVALLGPGLQEEDHDDILCNHQVEVRNEGQVVDSLDVNSLCHIDHVAVGHDHLEVEGIVHLYNLVDILQDWGQCGRLADQLLVEVHQEDQAALVVDTLGNRWRDSCYFPQQACHFVLFAVSDYGVQPCPFHAAYPPASSELNRENLRCRALLLTRIQPSKNCNTIACLDDPLSLLVGTSGIKSKAAAYQ